jgi:cytochrome P450
MSTVATISDEFELPPHIGETIINPTAFTNPAAIGQMFAWLRANNPLGLARVEGYMPFWVVTKHADVLEVTRRNDIYDSTSKPFVLGATEQIERMREINGGADFPFQSLTGTDEPEHGVIRKLFTPLFQNQGMKAMEPRVRAIARTHVDRMAAAGGQCDFVKEIALAFPLRVMMDFMGVPPQDEPLMVKITEALFSGDDDEINADALTLTPAQQAEQMRAAFQPMEDYFAALTASRVADPRDDVATLIANGRVNGQLMSSERALGHYLSFATAGHHTTASSLAGAVQILCEYPEHLETLRADPSIIPVFVEEALRWVTPAKHFMRCASVDTELRGRKIARGDWMYVSYASANRDEEAFEAPFEFRPNRKPIKHVSFGFGVHQCLGNMLARQELRFFLEEFVARVGSLEMVGEPRLTKSRWVQGLKTLPIRYKMGVETD